MFAVSSTSEFEFESSIPNTLELAAADNDNILASQLFLQWSLIDDDEWKKAYDWFKFYLENKDQNSIKTT